MSAWNVAFGRKVLFVNPGYITKTLIIPDLLKMEYEVYYVDNPRYVKALLRTFPDSICFFDIDSGMTEDEYFNLILSIESAPEFSNVLIGVISRKTGTVQRKFMMNIKLSAGFLPGGSSRELLLNTLTNVLELNEVKGRRQYVRISIPEGAGASFTCQMGDRKMRFALRDISACGFACSASGFTEKDFVLNSIQQGNLSLGQMNLPVTTVLYALKPSASDITLVMLFSNKGNPWNLKRNIRAFTTLQLQIIVYNICLHGGLDTVDYTRAPEESTAVEVLADLEEYDDSNFYEDDDNQGGLSYTDINAAR